MFRSKTLFIVGAGASSEFGFPVGSGLKDIIAKKLDFEFGERYEVISGDRAIWSSIINILKNEDRYTNSEINNIIEACRVIRDAMPIEKSIDSFVESHKNNRHIQLCVKLGIAASILEAERESSLYINNIERQSKLDFEKNKNKWIASFFKKLKENCSIDSLKKSIENVSFIIFNYDRSVEHFIRHAIATYFHISFDDACNIANNLKIIHPYGVIGQLPNKILHQKIDFGEVSVTNIIAAANEIKTFSENISDHSSLAGMRNFVEQAETIVFLGFAFHEQNMKLIYTDKKSNALNIFATAMGFSDHNSKQLQSEINSALKSIYPTGRSILVNNTLACAALFDEYSRSL
jgi:hypothetical protein